MQAKKDRRSRQRGTALIEFVLCFGLVWVPLFLGSVQFGFALVQAIQVNQVCRDAGHMSAYGFDFSQSSNKYLLAGFAPGLRVDPTGAGGAGIVILSTIVYVDDGQCLTGGYIGNVGCSNYQKYVFTRRIVIGNPALQSSAFGTPSAALMDSSGNIRPGSPTMQGYLNNSSTIAVGFDNVIPSPAPGVGQPYIYVSEMSAQPTGLNLYFPGTQWVSSRNVF
jgi:TadE-like protein